MPVSRRQPRESPCLPNRGSWLVLLLMPSRRNHLRPRRRGLEHRAAGARVHRVALSPAGALLAGDLSREGVRTMTRLLTVEEVAERLGVRKQWVWAQARAGRIPCVRLGRYRRFRE